MQIISTPPKWNDINKRSVGAAVRGSLLVSTLKSAVAHKQQKKEALGAQTSGNLRIWELKPMWKYNAVPPSATEAPKSANIKSIQLN